MSEAFEDFTGRTAIVTGAGGGLARAYALWLARRGCAVVVNNRDRPDGSSTAPKVVEEITAAGGRAVAHIGAVEEPASGPAMVELAERSFGPVDILVCNAGVQRWAGFGGIDLEDFRRIVDVSLWGTVYPVHAAWPDMAARGYGRIWLTSSGAGLWGQPQSADYSLAKAAMVGFARGLALDAPKDGDLRINVVAPAAYTAMSSSVVPDAWADYMSADYVAPVVGWLCSAACRESGQVFYAGADRVRRMRMLEGPIGRLSQTPVGELMSRADDRVEPASSFGAGQELMPELFAALNAG